jgi:hypothetical protein
MESQVVRGWDRGPEEPGDQGYGPGEPGNTEQESLGPRVDGAGIQSLRTGARGSGGPEWTRDPRSPGTGDRDAGSPWTRNKGPRGPREMGQRPGDVNCLTC